MTIEKKENAIENNFDPVLFLNNYMEINGISE